MTRVALLMLCLIAARCGSNNAGGETASAAPPPATSAAAAGGTADACALLTTDQINAAVGNPVTKGQPFAGPEVCKWDVDTPGDVTVLVTVRLPGSLREQGLCPDLRKQGRAPGFESVADASTWKFESVIGLFNSGEFESCGAKGYVGVTLNGKRDEPRLKEATLSLVRSLLAKL